MYLNAIIDGEPVTLRAIRASGMYLVCEQANAPGAYLCIDGTECTDIQQFRALWAMLGGAAQNLRWPDGAPVTDNL